MLNKVRLVMVWRSLNEESAAAPGQDGPPQDPTERIEREGRRKGVGREGRRVRE